eukprot:TRINITY_DN27792_c0_g1_i1.p1 TRINITY_DN27792_c0_g1~~TRINITY_DN27792_c0_g1_i1.p1  ORF type:complete len:431 (-),score=93.75 TRINITY_DN27792_c0_g1_i1:91-1383(-)
MRRGRQQRKVDAAAIAAASIGALRASEFQLFSSVATVPGCALVDSACHARFLRPCSAAEAARKISAVPRVAEVSRGTLLARVSGCAVAAGAAAAASANRFSQRLLACRPALLVVAAVLQKCTADGLTWYTRTNAAISYSGASVTILSELLKFPVLVVAIALFDSPRSIVSTFRSAATRAPFLLAWVGAAYAVQNLLYFVCLDHISAASYQLLSQSKLLFTAGLMRVMLGKRFSNRQLLALGLLCSGVVFTQLAESAEAQASGAALRAGHGNVGLGCALTLLSAILAALPNVFYERMLKDKEQSEWVANLQLTTWITIWVLAVKLWDMGAAAVWTQAANATSAQGLLDAWAALTHGFTPAVWLIVLLKTLNCVIIPAVLKYGDNILYSYSKPASIVLMCIVTAFLTATMPMPLMVFGIVMVLVSMVIYSKA